MSGERYKPYLVLRLQSREVLAKKTASIFRYFKSDRFECGVVTDALVQACRDAKMARWGIAPVVVSDDIVVFYLGSEHRLESAVAFLNTQMIDDDSERYLADRPLRDATYLKHSYLCRGGCRHHYCAWWCLDVDRQFALFKTQDSARLFLSALLTTDPCEVRLVGVGVGEKKSSPREL